MIESKLCFDSLTCLCPAHQSSGCTTLIHQSSAKRQSSYESTSENARLLLHSYLITRYWLAYNGSVPKMLQFRSRPVSYCVNYLPSNPDGDLQC
jgi:hypothetical protein